VRPRLVYLDTVKTALVAGVIYGHAWAGYSSVAERSATVGN
jgi:hypothetical protein